MGTFSALDYAVLIIYFGAMAALGPLFASKARTTEGYFLGDRSFPGWLVGFSMFATSISSVTFMAYPGDAFKTAWYRMTPNYMLPIACLIAAYYFLPFFRRSGTVSAYEYLEGRFGKWTRLYAASAFLVAQAIRVSLILFLVSILLEKMTGINVYVCILLGGIITSFYTVLGGIRAVLWTDFIQACVLWVGGVISLIYIIDALPGGLGQIFSEASAAGKFAMADLNAEGVMEPIQFSPDFTKKTVTLFLLVGLGNWLFEYSGNQNIIQRYAASKSAKQAKIAMWTCCIFSVPTWALFMFLGTALWVFFQVKPTPEAEAILTGTGGAKAEDILPYFVISFLPKGLSGLVIAGVLAAAMSSLSSSINGVSAVGIVDIYKRHLAKGKTDRHYVIVAKLIGLGLAVFMIGGAILLHKMQNTTLQDSATILTALTSGGLLGIYLIGFFTKVGDDLSILVGIGFTMVFTLWMTLTNMGWLPETLAAPIHSYYAGILGHLLMFVVGFAMGSIVKRSKDHDLTNLTVWTQDGQPME